MLTDQSKVSPHSDGPQAPRSSPERSVCAVTVTHGDRQHLIRPVLHALLKEPAVWKIVVVSNAAQWNVQALASELGPERIELIEFPTNRGSSAAYAAGIKRACELRTELIWLLDDDNKAQDGALPELLRQHARLCNDSPKDKLLVLGYRPTLLDDVAGGWNIERRPSSFFGFHVADVPYKLWRRTPWGRPGRLATLLPVVKIPNGPFGGLLFHRAVIETNGLPREDFVIYSDDTEFTYRITRNGGTLVLVTAARVADLEGSWHHPERSFWGSFVNWLEGASDSRMFYGARNRAYLDSHDFPHGRLMFWINRKIYCCVLRFLAQVFRRTSRYRVLQKGIKDGLEGRLGMRAEYPL